MKKEIEEISLANTKKHIKENGVYYTPPELIEFMYDIVKRYGKGNPKNVYDPTIGAGALLTPFEDDVPKYGQEINGEQLEIAKGKLKHFNYYVGDTLQDPAFEDIKFDLIMSNYPFSMKWEQKEDWRFSELPVLPPKSKADYAFIVHCLKYLADDGVAVILGFPGITYRGNAEGKIRKWLIEQNYISEVNLIPSGKFEDTNISTLILVLQKNKTNTDILFKDIENNLEKKVTLEEIKENDYNLSISTYIEKKDTREKVDVFELTKELYLVTIRKTLNSLSTDKMCIGVIGKDKNYMKIYNKYLNIIIEKVSELKYKEEEINQAIEEIEEEKLQVIDDMLNDVISGKIEILF